MGKECIVAVKLRLKKTGRRHQPFFRLCAFDSRDSRDGRPIEELGLYDPNNKDPNKQVVLKSDRIKHWLSTGAQTTETVCDLLNRAGIACGPASTEAGV
jgi:small subunit ribosomal protein S16